jgi:hypothetical protein
VAEDVDRPSTEQRAQKLEQGQCEGSTTVLECGYHRRGQAVGEGTERSLRPVEGRRERVRRCACRRRTCPKLDLTRLDVALFNWPRMPWAITTAGCGPSPSGRYSLASSSSPETVGIRIVVRGPANLNEGQKPLADNYSLTDAHARTCAKDETEEGECGYTAGFRIG